jgi:hypothetical protein
MKAMILISLCLFNGAFLFADDEKKEKSYPDRIKEAYDDKVKEGKELYDKGVKDAKEKYADTFDKGKNLTEKSKEWVIKDLENIGDWEYKVVSYGPKETKALEKDLNELGNERWQCFWVEVSGKEKVFYFKRTKMSYMSKIPMGTVLRILADFQNN